MGYKVGFKDADRILGSFRTSMRSGHPNGLWEKEDIQTQT